MYYLYIYIIAIIIGIITGWIFFIFYKKYTQKYHGPNSSIVKNTIHKKDNKCYILEPAVYLCPIF